MLSARGTARLLLCPFRRAANYGFYVFGVTLFFFIIFSIGFEPVASDVGGFHRWRIESALLENGYLSALYRLISWVCGWGLALILATLFLMKKRPSAAEVTGEPFRIWFLLNLVCAIGLVSHQIWAAAILVIAFNLLLPLIALRNNRLRALRS